MVLSVTQLTPVGQTDDPMRSVPTSLTSCAPEDLFADVYPRVSPSALVIKQPQELTDAEKASVSARHFPSWPVAAQISNPAESPPAESPGCPRGQPALLQSFTYSITPELFAIPIRSARVKKHPD